MILSNLITSVDSYNHYHNQEKEVIHLLKIFSVLPFLTPLCILWKCFLCFVLVFFWLILDVSH